MPGRQAPRKTHTACPAPYAPAGTISSGPRPSGVVDGFGTRTVSPPPRCDGIGKPVESGHPRAADQHQSGWRRGQATLHQEPKLSGLGEAVRAGDRWIDVSRLTLPGRARRLNCRGVGGTLEGLAQRPERRYS